LLSEQLSVLKLRNSTPQFHLPQHSIVIAGAEG
jgi:hypothetical protein